MKRIIALLLVFTIALGTVACASSHENSTTEETPEVSTAEATSLPAIEDECTVYGYSLKGLNSDEVPKALAAMIRDYAINVNLDNTEFSIHSSALGIELNPAFNVETAFDDIRNGKIDASYIEKNLFLIGDVNMAEEAMLSAYLTALEQILADSKAAKAAADDAKKNNTPLDESVGVPLTKDEEAQIRATIDGLENPTKAYVQYDKDSSLFVSRDGKAGKAVNYSQAAADVLDAASKLADQVTVTSSEMESEGEKATDNTAVQRAVAEANTYLDLQIEYIFDCPSAGINDTVVLSKDQIAGLIFVSKANHKVIIDTDELTSFTSKLASKYSKVSVSRATVGKKVTTTRDGWKTDSNTIYQNIYSCLSEKKSGSFKAEFSRVNEKTTENYEGRTYIHVNLDAQKVYMYIKGEKVLSSSCVSGCVYNKTRSDTGTFSIYSKDRDRYLTGRNYRSYVNYFMPYNGGEGLHDATWRDSFGGTIYLYSGSHGCINMPLSKMEQFYEKAYVGMQVVVSGGATSVDGKLQQITAPSTITLYEDETAQIEASALCDVAFEYSGYDYDTINVSETGLITAYNVGETQVKILALATSEYASASLTITVTVLSRAPVTPTTLEPTTPEPTTTQVEPTTSQTEPSTSQTEPSTSPTTTEEEPTSPQVEPSTEPTDVSTSPIEEPTL